MKDKRNPFKGEDSEVDIDPSSLGQSLLHDLGDYMDDLLVYRMPFGRYEGRFLEQLPYEYLHWFAEKGGFPTGRLGELLEFVYQTKAVGAEIIFSQLGEQRK